MTLKIEFHLKINVTQNGMSFKIECHSKQNGKNWNVTQIGMFLKLQWHWNLECHSYWNVTEIEISLDL